MRSARLRASKAAPALLAAVVGLLAAIPELRAQDQPPLPEGLSALPELVTAGQAVYPGAALDAGVQADVLFQITIDVSGRVPEAVATSVVLYTFDDAGELVEQRIAPDEDPYGFVEPARRALLDEFVFSPALDDEGEPVAVALIWRYGFYFEEEQTAVEAPEEPGETTPDDESTPALDVVNLRGQLIERGTRDPIGGAEVLAYTDVEARTAVTDALGVFEFRGLAPATWTLEIDATGYERVEQREEVAAGERTDVTYYLERESYGEYTYEVREQAVRREVSRQTLSVVEINRVPGNNGDAVKVVQNLPGFARAPFNGGLVVIRGSAPEDSRVFVEGIFVPLIFHFGGLTSVINSDLLDRVEYIPGAFSVEYGRATGGVINVETRAPQTDRLHGYVDVDVFDASVLIEGPITEGWSFFAAARRSYVDAIIPAVIPEDAGLSLTVAPRYWDYQAKLQYDPSPEHSFSLLAFGSDDALAFLVEEPPADPTVRGNVDTGIQFHRLRFEWVGELRDDLTNRLVASWGVQDLEFSAGDDLFFILDTMPMVLRDTLEWRITDTFRLRPGLDLEYTRLDARIRLPRPNKEGEVPVTIGASEIVEIDVDDEILYEPATFLEAQWDAIEGLTLTPGVRLEYYRTIDQWAFDGRFSARYDLTEAWTLKGAVGTFHQSPVPDETNEDFGNPELDLEWAIHYVLGTEVRFTDYLSLDFQLFWKDLNHLVTRSDNVVERDGEMVPEIYNNEGDGRAYGAEILLRHTIANHFFGWASYTLSRSERRDALGQAYRLFSWDQTHILALVASYELPHDWAVGARFRYVTGIPRTPIVGSVYDSDSDVYVRIPGEPRSVRVDDFHQLDVRVDKRFVFDNWVLDLYLDIQNIYNRANPETIDYNFDYSEAAPTTGLPIIPSLGIRGSF